MAEKGVESHALFPAIQDIKKGGDGYFAPNSLTKLRARVTADSGVLFDLRACRRTFGQENVNQGVPIDAVSRMLGHATTMTTEKYYCRKSNEMAIEQAQKVYKDQPKNRQNIVIRPDRKRRISENFFRLTG